MAWIEIDGKEIPLLEAPETRKETPRRVLQVFFKYQRLIRNVFLSISLPAFALVLLSPQRYVGMTKVFIKPSRAFLNLTPGAGDQALSVQPSQDVMNSEIQIIKSREVRERLAKEVPFPDKSLFSYRGGIDATPVKASSIIEIRLVSTNPEWAAKAVNRAAELYQEQSVKVRRTQGIEKFYDEQENRLRNDLVKAEQDFKDFQQREGIVDASKEVDASLAGSALAEKNLKETESQILETEKRISVLEAQLKSQQPTISTNKQVTVDPAYASIRARLTQLELERDSLLQRYMPKDRLVVDKEREIADLKKRLAEAEKTSVGSESISLNEVYRRILNELLTAKVQLQSLREKRAADTNQVASYSATAASKKKLSFEFDRLQQAVNAKKDALALYKKKAEEARISDAMDEQKFGNVYILDRARLPLPPAGRSTLVWFVVIVVLSGAAAFGVAFGINYLDPTIQDEAYVEEEFGLPVLATIQHYDTQHPDYFIAKG
ncbi:MAG: GumC family protein [Chloroflexota bacterium]